eukprot:TRINITY_DN968_c0_g1_i1.p1 TRINITY_DN968_c0_g1~~TRINITY_DN968_c0_g1_i1.p1  ORF type:complete len:227 (+),score=101.09 TRINITY_DN968_c0_g1_i1:54-734(+)
MPSAATSMKMDCDFQDGFARVLVSLTRPARGAKTVFDGPAMQVEKYAKVVMPKLSKKIGAGPEDMVIALILIDRLTYVNPAYFLSQATLHRLLYTALVVAMKTQHDVLYSNKVYAQCASLSLQELNAMEVAFLTALDFDVHVDASDFEAYCAQLRSFACFGGALQSYAAPAPAPHHGLKKSDSLQSVMSAQSWRCSEGSSPAMSLATYPSWEGGYSASFSSQCCYN